MARREADFAGLFEAGWFQRHLTTLLTYEDAICLALMAIECNLESLHQVLLYNVLLIPPIPILKLANYVAERGWWHLMVQLPREARRPLRDSLSTKCFLDETPMVQCQWIIRYHPYELRDSVFYAAVRRGNLEEIQWLHEYIRYSPSRAIDEVAEAHQLTAVQWLLDRWGGERGYFETLLRLEDSSLNVICWRTGDFVVCGDAAMSIEPCSTHSC